MFPSLNERPSDSPLVERVWSTQSGHAGAFTTIATAAWSMVVAKCQGRLSISFHGPVTRAALQEFPPEAEWFGIEFKLGTFAPATVPGTFLDGFVVLPAAGGSFSWGPSHWEIPSFENADTFVARLARAGILEREPLLNTSRRENPPALSVRMKQYRFARATGLAQRTVRQIERARRAAALLKSGVSILDTVDEAGYSDQPHLTRSLKHFIGHTPGEVPSSVIVGLHRSL